MNQPTENQPTFNRCNSSWPHITLATKDQHSSSSCKGTSGLLHIMGSNTMIFAVLKAWLMSPLHCVINWEVFLHWLLHWCRNKLKCQSVRSFWRTRRNEVNPNQHHSLDLITGSGGFLGCWTLVQQQQLMKQLQPGSSSEGVDHRHGPVLREDITLSHAESLSR